MSQWNSVTDSKYSNSHIKKRIIDLIRHRFQVRRAANGILHCSIPKAWQTNCLPLALAGNGQLRIRSIYTWSCSTQCQLYFYFVFNCTILRCKIGFTTLHIMAAILIMIFLTNWFLWTHDSNSLKTVHSTSSSEKFVCFTQWNNM